jgi:hypothetical protein
MAYYTTGITVIGSEDVDGGVLLRVITTHTDKAIQCYLSGRFVAYRIPENAEVQFLLPRMLAADTLFFLAVDLDEAETDYFDDAYTVASANANRIKIVTPRLAGQGRGLRWRVYRGDAGDASADTLVHEENYYDGRETGYGYDYGTAYGYGPPYAGYGFSYGSSYGFGADNLEWVSEPLPPGVYPVKVTVVDAAGNESTAATDTVTLTTYPRPATDLAIDSYVKGTDTLTLTWTASPDIT